MELRCDDTQELITGLVDNELSNQERLSIEGHLRNCSKCRFIYGQEQTLKKEIRLVGANVRAPVALRDKIMADLRIVPARPDSAIGWKRIFQPTGPLFRPAWVMVLLLLLALPLLYLMRSPGQPLSTAVLETHQAILGGTLSFVRAESRQEIAKQLSEAVGGRFAPMKYDMSNVNLQAAGGIVREIEGRKVLVVVYEGKAPSLTCYTFLGTEGDAPTNANVVFDREKKMNFYTFSHAKVNGVLHREGKVICILVSKMPMADLLAVARAKAQPT
ncbi:MAG: zf-HC2 domain-containing protein [Candidatus Binatia bacterium]